MAILCFLAGHFLKEPCGHGLGFPFSGNVSGLFFDQAFIEQRKHEKNQGHRVGPMTLFFGGRHAEAEYYYRDEPGASILMEGPWGRNRGLDGSLSRDIRSGVFAHAASAFPFFHVYPNFYFIHFMNKMVKSVELMISPDTLAALAWLRFEKFEAEGLVKCCNAWSRDQKQKVRGRSRAIVCHQ